MTDKYFPKYMRGHRASAQREAEAKEFRNQKRLSEGRAYKNGESLLEALIAISVLMLVLGFSGIVISDAYRGVRFSRDRATALTLAEEGIEGVKNILASNIVRLSSDTDNCWNSGWDATGNPWNNATDCAAVNKIGDPENYIDFQNFRLIFNPTTATFRLDNIGITTALIDASADVYRLYVSGNRYFHDNESITSSVATKFYRSVSFKYLKISDPNATDPDAMEVHSKVLWIERGKPSVVEFSTVLTKNFLQ